MATATLLPASGYRTMAWKNGGGVTHEIALEPATAGLDGKPFDWRLSLAEIAGSNDFSRFPGIDRTLVLLSGGPVTLQIDAAAPRSLAPLDVIRFPGAATVRCTLDGTAARDLNVMVARGRMRADVQVLRLPQHARHDHAVAGAATVLLHVVTGELEVQAPDTRQRVPAHATLRIDRPGTAPLALQSATDVVAIAVSLLRVAGAHGPAGP